MYKIANQKIKESKLSKDPMSRCSLITKKLLEKEYVIDVHTHFFDIKCINKTYFLLRVLKDFLGLKSVSESELEVEYSANDLYGSIDEYEENWENNLFEKLNKENNEIRFSPDGKKGIIDIIKATKFLKFKKMEDVYEYYIENFSLAEPFNLSKTKVLTTALMMDLEIGWNAKIKKTAFMQIEELHQLSKKYPVLPFLFCDPRRAEIDEDEQNLYALFNKAFCGDTSFFGVKIYPALGYDPSDYRLWPIYSLCEKYKIPVLSHCGGESISTGKREINIYEGENKVLLKANNRKELAYKLNDPWRWSLVLEKFPKLKLNLAHFGGYETWSSATPVNADKDPQQRKEVIFSFIKKYQNVYADFSYNIVEVDLTKNLKSILFFEEEIRNKTLFGTDFWVVNKEGDLQKEQTQCLMALENGIEELDLKNKLCKLNPYNYLFL
jgi:predicted TIM-barrel fold metal-dependent hydrolase